MSDEQSKCYPVPGRSELLNLRIATHETGHAFLAKILGNSVYSASIIPGDGFDGRVVRSGPKTAHVFSGADQTREIVDVCAMLETIQPEIGTPRIDDAHVIIIGQSSVIELVGGLVAERIFHPDMDDLGTLHDYREAIAFGTICCAGGAEAVEGLVGYAEAEAEALIRKHFDVFLAMREALVANGKLSGEEIDLIITDAIATHALQREQERRADWAQREANAVAFKAETA